MPAPTPRSRIARQAPALVVAALVGSGLLAAVIGRVSGEVGRPPTSSAIASRDLRFEDRADGAVLIYDASGTRPFDVVTGQAGFLRGTLRGLALARRSEGLGDAAPFRLAAWADGRLTLDDPATGRHIELDAFGPTNAAVFAHLLPGIGRS